jgi:DNA-binding NarL/FixJ family response regulator
MRQVLGTDATIEVVGEAKTAADAMRFNSAQPNIVVAGGDCALATVQAFRQRMPCVGLIVVGHAHLTQTAKRLVRMGVQGLVTEAESPRKLLEAIQTVASGGLHVHFDPLPAIASARRSEGHDALSDREFQVLTLLATGWRLPSIAATLSVSDKSVNVYRERALRKLNLRTDSELTRYAVQNGLIC